MGICLILSQLNKKYNNEITEQDIETGEEICLNCKNIDDDGLKIYFSLFLLLLFCAFCHDLLLFYLLMAIHFLSCPIFQFDADDEFPFPVGDNGVI